MSMSVQPPVIRDLVLVGGGHSHVAVLKAFAMRPLSGVRVTLVSRRSATPYSGMLPGLIAGHYSEAEAHIDLVPLCRFVRARFIAAEVFGIDLRRRELRFEDRAPLPFDIASINCGSTPSIGKVAHTGGELILVKPIDRFLRQWHELRARLEQSNGRQRIAVIGGGAGGVELALSIEHNLRGLNADVELSLYTAEADILTTHAAAVRQRFRRIFAERGIALGTSTRVVERNARGVVTEQGETIELDEVLFVTHAAAAPWIRESGLAVDEQGFLLVDEYLRSVSDPEIFGAGDVAAMQASPRPKSGVFAVRQGAPLARNLRKAILTRPLARFRPQRRFLSLIGTGEPYAVASRGRWSAEGRWVWTWKDWIDRRFMAKYQDLPAMRAKAPPPVPDVLQRELPYEEHDDGMRCGGCGAKLSASALAKALRPLKPMSRSDVIVGLDRPDDAAIVSVPQGQLSVLSVDAFRPLVDDSYLFGRIAANHCLNDLFAVGAAPQSALAIVALPVWPERKLVDELAQMLTGAIRELEHAGAALVGGHTGEGQELSLGFAVTGLVTENMVLHKRGLRDGDKLVVTKALGTGTIFAADMRARARGSWVDAALGAMLQSNDAASRCLRSNGARACTDITGFGLAGHLLEMIDGDSVGLIVNLDAVPALPGAQDLLRQGWVSTLHEKNVAAAAAIDAERAARRHGKYALLFDPQTAGGLVAGVPAPHAADCLTELRALGYADAAIVGEVTSTVSGGLVVR